MINPPYLIFMASSWENIYPCTIIYSISTNLGFKYNNDHFNYWSERPKQEGWEGIMLRKNIGYEGKRSKNLLKVKMFHDAEYVVRSIDSDMHEVVRDGKSEAIEMLSQVYIMHKGYSVAVGSGFTQEQRIKYHNSF